ncbi:MAG: tetratricopeptide repeat protein [Muribaculaceae bacterium]|nr:tetratricopeptide repeat protein [Muribaculaceae bacterium]
MKNAKKIISTIALSSLLASIPAAAATSSNEMPTTKQERNYIRQGNKLYGEKRFADAEVAYRKALEALPGSEIAKFNLAAALIRQSGSADPNSGNNPVNTATQLLQEIAGQSTDAYLAGKSFYNLGNLAFNSQDFGKSIELYKNALRKNPDDDKARENLRIAQLKQQQQNQDQNQDQNKDQNQDQEQNQDQNKDQNQDQNQDQNKDQNKDQNQNQNQDKDQNKQQQPQGSISDANAEKILKAMENEEAATRKRVEAEKKKADAARRKKITNPW